MTEEINIEQRILPGDSVRRDINDHTEKTGEQLKHLAKRAKVTTAHLNAFLIKKGKFTDTKLDDIVKAIWNFKNNRL